MAGADMRVVVSSSARFHHFDLARELYKRDYLHHLYTGYFSHQVGEIPRERITSVPWLIAPKMLASRHGWGWFARKINWTAVETFDRAVAAKMTPCDILVCNHSNGLSSYRTARKFGARIVCDCGQGHVQYIRDTLREEYRIWGEEFEDYSDREFDKRLREYAEADLITVPSNFSARTFVQHGVDPSKLAVLPYGVGLSAFRPVPKEDTVFRILFVGNAAIHKGIGYLMEAFAALKTPNIELVTIGGISGGARKLLKKYRHDARWCDLGFLPRTELYRYYSQASVLVLPSVVEGLALVMAQAMACGVPVIASHNTGAENLFTDGVEGFIVPARNSAELRDRIAYLYGHPTVRDTMAEAALRRVRQIGGWDQYGEKAIQIYRQLLRNGN